MRSDISAFDELPDQAVVPISTVCAVTQEGPSTIWRKAKTEPLLTPIKLGPGVTRFQVGKLRQYMRGAGIHAATAPPVTKGFGKGRPSRKVEAKSTKKRAARRGALSTHR